MVSARSYDGSYAQLRDGSPKSHRTTTESACEAARDSRFEGGGEVFADGARGLVDDIALELVEL